MAVQIPFRRMGTRQRELEGVGDLLLNLMFHPVNGALGQEAGAGQVLAEHSDRAERFPRLTLGFGSIARSAVVAGASVRPEPVHRGLDERRAVSRPRAIDGVLHLVV